MEAIIERLNQARIRNQNAKETNEKLKQALLDEWNRLETESDSLEAENALLQKALGETSSIAPQANESPQPPKKHIVIKRDKPVCQLVDDDKGMSPEALNKLASDVCNDIMSH